MNEKKLENRFILKNLAAFCFVFLLNLSSNNAIVKLQSIINQKGGIGILSLLFGCIIQLTFCIVFPQLLSETIGVRWSMSLASFAGLLLVSANLYPNAYTLTSASMINGIFATVVWTLVGIYLQKLSERYAKNKNIDVISVKSLFFGVFGSVVLFSNVLGSIVIGLILKPPESSSVNSTLNTQNETFFFDYQVSCGTANCPGTKLPQSSSRPSDLSIYLLCASLMTISLASSIIAIFFIDEVNDNSDKNAKKPPSISQRFQNEFKNLAKLSKLNLILLSPIGILIGFELTFLWTEFNRAFISCLTSINYIGWTSILFGTLGAAFSFGFGYLAKYTTTVPLMVMSILTSFGIGIFLLSWTPVPNLFILFMLNVAYALTQSITNAQLRSTFSVQFKNNTSAFSALSLFQNTGFLIGFLSSAYFCTLIKLLIYVTLSFISLVCYFTLIAKNNYVIAQKKKNFKRRNLNDDFLVAETKNTESSNKLII